ncbi:MAG: RNA polymerase sigma factor [bacterium]|nr:RNA polymerase sigma factor [bacterium]
MNNSFYNPFIEKIEENDKDIELISLALGGSSRDLERLILRHQAWIYNISYKMIFDHDEAEDITQEILIKMITKLATYKPEKAAFRTWLYRIAANHIINMEKKKKETVLINDQFLAENFSTLDNIPDTRKTANPEFNILVEETKISCLTGLLFCLDRRQRLVVILGDIFNVTDTVGSEILEISKPNFRKILSRSRERLYNFINRRCSLVNPDNPCSCSRQVKNMINSQWVNPDAPQNTKEALCRINDIVQKNINSSEDESFLKYIALYREQSFYKPEEKTLWLNKLLNNEFFEDIFQLN